MGGKIQNLSEISDLILLLTETQNFFLKQVQKQVNTALTLRNWLFGFYIYEYEMNGSDRAEYGKGIMKEIAQRSVHIKGLSERNLYLFRTFYLSYPKILQSLTAKSFLTDFRHIPIFQTVTGKLQLSYNNKQNQTVNDACDKLETNPEILINRLSFTHIIELLKADTLLKRFFYETEAIKNNWSVRELQRAMNSLLYERTGMSKNKEEFLERHSKGSGLNPEDVFRNPLMLEFLGLEEKKEYSETDLETAVIDHLQKFLIEIGRGFCFEARQKRITFDNRHYRIDLVFYHRILKCNVLIDLKIGEFDHADAGQMNVYLNYYKENEMNEGDNPPVGIILCASRNENLVKYATAGLPQQVFVSKYLVNLPTESELKKIIQQEQDKISNTEK
jgi:predicted nuclease of restriction endonuclease-like (RecB) superfamily